MVNGMVAGHRGISPIIATVMLTLIAISLAVFVWGFMQEFWVEQTEATASTTGEATACSEGGIKISACTYIAGLQKVQLTVENTGVRDFKSFWVNVQYAGGSATQVKSDQNILAGDSATVDGNALVTPSKVKVQTVECYNISDSTTSCS